MGQNLNNCSTSTTNGKRLSSCSPVCHPTNRTPSSRPSYVIRYQMAEPAHFRSESYPSRRNLPRASHACQRCRLKRSKCDQRQPCANCIKHSEQCVYGLRRRNGRNRNSCIPEQISQAADRTQHQLPSPLSTSGRGSIDGPQRRREAVEHDRREGPVGKLNWLFCLQRYFTKE